jgi:hypothetical protein
MSLGDPVGEQQQPVTGSEGERVNRVLGGDEQPQRQLWRNEEFADRAVPHQQRRRVPGVEHRPGAAVHVEFDDEAGYEVRPRELFNQVPIGGRRLLDDRGVRTAGVAHRRARKAGQQRRPQSVASSVADRHGQPVRTDRVIEVVSADLVRRLHRARDGERGQLEGQAGQQLPLDLRSQPEFAPATQHLEPIGVAASAGQHVPQHPRDIVEDIHRTPAHVTPRKGHREDPKTLGPDRHREIDHHRGPVHTAARGPGRNSIPGLIHDGGDGALLSIGQTRSTVEQVLRVDPGSRGAHRHRLQTRLRVVRQQYDAGTRRHMPGQPPRADFNQFAGRRLIQIPQQRADTGPSRCGILRHRSHPATTIPGRGPTTTGRYKSTRRLQAAIEMRYDARIADQG